MLTAFRNAGMSGFKLKRCFHMRPATFPPVPLHALTWHLNMDVGSAFLGYSVGCCCFDENLLHQIQASFDMVDGITDKSLAREPPHSHPQCGALCLRQIRARKAEGLSCLVHKCGSSCEPAFGLPLRLWSRVPGNPAPQPSEIFAGTGVSGAELPTRAGITRA